MCRHKGRQPCVQTLQSVVFQLHLVVTGSCHSAPCIVVVTVCLALLAGAPPPHPRHPTSPCPAPGDLTTPPPRSAAPPRRIIIVCATTGCSFVCCCWPTTTPPSAHTQPASARPPARARPVPGARPPAPARPPARPRCVCVCAPPRHPARLARRPPILATPTPCPPAGLQSIHHHAHHVPSSCRVATSPTPLHPLSVPGAPHQRPRDGRPPRLVQAHTHTGVCRRRPAATPRPPQHRFQHHCLRRHPCLHPAAAATTSSIFYPLTPPPPTHPPTRQPGRPIPFMSGASNMPIIDRCPTCLARRRGPSPG